MDRFRFYRRGQIVQVKFEPQTGYEIKGLHYAIVVTKRDQPYIGTVTVIPLTSKSGNHLLPLGNFLGDEIIKGIDDAIKEMQLRVIDLDKRTNEISNKTTSADITSMSIERNLLVENLKEIQALKRKYKNIKEASYANILQITTVDKSKILNPMNRLDPIKRIQVPNDILNLIDSKIIESFTNAEI